VIAMIKSSRLITSSIRDQEDCQYGDLQGFHGFTMSDCDVLYDWAPPTSVIDKIDGLLNERITRIAMIRDATSAINPSPSLERSDSTRNAFIVLLSSDHLVR
jgi:hypothetical protein